MVHFCNRDNTRGPGCNCERFTASSIIVQAGRKISGRLEGDWRAAEICLQRDFFKLLNYEYEGFCQKCSFVINGPVQIDFSTLERLH